MWTSLISPGPRPRARGPARGPTASALALAVIVAALAAPTMAEPKRRAGGRPDRVLIPAGLFVRGSTAALDERPVVKVRLPVFRIDRTEVTRAMYARCVASKRCSKPGIDLTIEDSLPVTQVSWHDARAYCAFAGGRLPTEAEWEKAARGSDGREYPWGPDADCSRANWGNFEGEGPCAGKNPGHPVAVGAYPTGASPYGVLDLAGNVWEWVEGAYEEDPQRRVVRGGSCCSYFVGPRASNRNAWDPDHRDGDLGFRCVAK
jgi:formylglycine-generating enzyme required for sulfatase activity